MPTLKHPGVAVQQSTFNTQVSSVPGSTEAAFVGYHPRGPLSPTVINSWSQFQNLYGGFSNGYPPSALSLAVYAFFTVVQTASCIVCRSVNGTSGTAPTTATETFSDNQGSPVPTLTVSGANPGAWANNIYILITAGNVVVGGVVQTFNITVYYGGVASSNIVERWTNLSMVPGSTYLGGGNYAPSMVNGNSAYITLTDLGDAATSPTDNPAPNGSPTALTGGTDGSAPSATDNYNALSLLDQFPNTTLLVNLPGINDTTNIANAVTYVSGRGDSFVVVDPPANLTPAAAVAWWATQPQTGYMATYYPWLVISDPYSTVRGATRAVPPGGAVVAAIVNTDSTRGVAKAPAGLQAQLTVAQGLVYTPTNSDQDTLTQGNVNALIPAQANQGPIIVWGARTSSNLQANLYVNTQRSMNYVQVNLISLTKFAVFENNDSVLWTAASSIVSQWLTSFWQSGGLAGDSAAQAFQVVCDGTINTQAVIDAGQFLMQVQVALQYPAEFVVINLSQSQAGSVVTNTLTSTAA